MGEPCCYMHAGKPAVQSCRQCMRPVCEVCAQVDEHDMAVRCPACLRAAHRLRRYKRFAVIGAITLLLLGGVSLWQWFPRPFQYAKYARTIRVLRHELRREPCDRPKALELVQTLFRAGNYRGSLKAADRFFGDCGDFSRLRWTTFEAHKMLSEYDEALADVAQLIAESPNDKDFWAWRGLVYEEQGELEKAAADFRQAISIEPRLTYIPFNLANVYERLGQPCEAIFPLEQFLYYYPKVRQEPRVQSQLTKLYKHPECEHMSGDGRAIVHFSPEATAIPVMAQFNGKAARHVIIDTGATWVTLSASFANELGIVPPRGSEVLVATAGGMKTAHLATVELIEVQGVRARKVPIAIVEDLGGHVDVLLGLSFLSRFGMEMNAAAGTLTLSARR